MQALAGLRQAVLEFDIAVDQALKDTPQLEALLQQRGHALLLTGPSGLGQYTLALALARAWLCEHATPHGACGQCETEVIACNGRIEHHDHWLSDSDHAANTKIMPCVSRFQGAELILDR